VSESGNNLSRKKMVPASRESQRGVIYVHFSDSELLKLLPHDSDLPTLVVFMHGVCYPEGFRASVPAHPSLILLFLLVVIQALGWALGVVVLSAGFAYPCWRMQSNLVAVGEKSITEERQLPIIAPRVLSRRDNISHVQTPCSIKFVDSLTPRFPSRLFTL
jgi:hypothetical protein